MPQRKLRKDRQRKPKTKVFFKRFKIPVFSSEVSVVCCESPEGAHRKVSSCGFMIDLEQFPNTVEARTFGFSGGRVLVWLTKFPKNSETIGVLVHELTHVATFIARYCGIVFSVDSEEVFAYVSGYLTTQILKEFLRI